MGYCVLNGLKSNTVKGLLIQELPPISKPLMRTQVTQIDGRDGDIVTPLGYAAYDKKMKIGLFGDFIIDDVISYFDSSGQVTFSNESDKYYNYQILQQIDFKRLFRFREAEVTFHVQPYKYSAVEGVLSLSGSSPVNVVNIGNTVAKPIITLTGSGNVELSINGNHVLTVNLDSGNVTIDSERMNAYNGTTLMNRYVIGDYDEIGLQPGNNTVSWAGNLTNIAFEHFSRWV